MNIHRYWLNVQEPANNIAYILQLIFYLHSYVSSFKQIPNVTNFCVHLKWQCTVYKWPLNLNTHTYKNSWFLRYMCKFKITYFHPYMHSNGILSIAQIQKWPDLQKSMAKCESFVLWQIQIESIAMAMVNIQNFSLMFPCFHVFHTFHNYKISDEKWRAGVHDITNEHDYLITANLCWFMHSPVQISCQNQYWWNSNI